MLKQEIPQEIQKAELKALIRKQEQKITHELLHLQSLKLQYREIQIDEYVRKSKPYIHQSQNTEGAAVSK